MTFPFKQFFLEPFIDFNIHTQYITVILFYIPKKFTQKNDKKTKLIN